MSEFNSLEQKINEYKSNTFQKTFILFQNYDTPIVNLIANPIKKSIAYVIIIIILGLVLKKLNMLKFILKIHDIKYYSIILLFIGICIGINQNTLNKNIEYLLKTEKKNITIYNFDPTHSIPDSNFLKIFNSILITTVIRQLLEFNLKGFEFINSGISIGI